VNVASDEAVYDRVAVTFEIPQKAFISVLAADRK
jgi:hypothetical protein